jgi:hypothetical protein
VYGSNQVGGKQVLGVFAAPASGIVDYSLGDITLGDPFDWIAQTYCRRLASLLEGNIFSVGLTVGGSGFGLSRLACSVALAEELDIARVDVEGQAFFTVAAVPEFGLESSFDIDLITLLKVLGDRFRGIAKDVGFEPDWFVGPIVAGAAAIVCTDRERGNWLAALHVAKFRVLAQVSNDDGFCECHD